MKIKHFLMALTSVACLTVFSACEDLLSLVDNGEEGEEQTEDPQGGEEGEDQPSDYIKQCIEKFNDMAPGIFTYRDEDHTALVAKGTDGSAFFIPDVNDYMCFYPTQSIKENPFPNAFEAIDSDKTHYKFVYGQPMHHANNHCQWQGEEWDGEMIYKLEDRYPSRTAMFADKGGATVMLVATAPEDKKKIDDAGNFMETYRKIAGRYQTFSHMIGPDKMMPQTTVWRPGQWLKDLYPDEMNTKKHVIPYTGKGDYYWFTVNRWMPTGPYVSDPYPSCFVDFVEYIEVYIENVSEADAKAYIEKVKSEGLITNIVHDEAFTETVDGKVYSNIWFEGNGQNIGEGELGHTYFYPGYEVVYMQNGEDFKTLTIKFTTNYTTIV